MCVFVSMFGHILVCLLCVIVEMWVLPILHKGSIAIAVMSKNLAQFQFLHKHSNLGS